MEIRPGGGWGQLAEGLLVCAKTLDLLPWDLAPPTGRGRRERAQSQRMKLRQPSRASMVLKEF